MYWLLGDETNKPPKPGQFFIYGGLIVETTKIGAIHKQVGDLRRNYGFRESDELKSSNQTKIARATHLKIKAAVLDLLVDNNVSFLATVVLQQVLANRTEQEYMEWAVNAITGSFHDFLQKREELGALFIDRVESKLVNATLEKMSRNFQRGLEYPMNYKRGVSDRIVMFGMTNNNSSHLSACTDIALGAFRYCANAVTGHANAKPEIAAEIMPRVNKLFWRERTDGAQFAPSGLQLLPRGVSNTYARHYGDLQTHLAHLSRGVPSSNAKPR